MYVTIVLHSTNKKLFDTHEFVGFLCQPWSYADLVLQQVNWLTAQSSKVCGSMNAGFMYILYLNFKGANPITKETHPKTDIATTLVVTKSIILILIRNTYHRKK